MNASVRSACDCAIAVALLVVGFACAELLEAPSWFLAAFTLPFLVYLHFRLDRRVRSFGFIGAFVGISLISAMVFDRFGPAHLGRYTGGVVVVVLASLLAHRASKVRARAET